MENGQEVADRLGGSGLGLPWITILDGEGKELTNSTGPEGNIGCPVKLEEQAYFVTMIERTVQHSDSDSIRKMQDALSAYAKSLAR